MKRNGNLCLDVRHVPTLEAAIDRWLSARAEFKAHRSDETELNYNATYFALGTEFTERYPEAAETPGAFEWYRRGLIAPEED
jgi:hypothetical protein